MVGKLCRKSWANLWQLHYLACLWCVEVFFFLLVQWNGKRNSLPDVLLCICFWYVNIHTSSYAQIHEDVRVLHTHTCTLLHEHAHILSFTHIHVHMHTLRSRDTHTHIVWYCTCKHFMYANPLIGANKDASSYYGKQQYHTKQYMMSRCNILSTHTPCVARRKTRLDTQGALL